MIHDSYRKFNAALMGGGDTFVADTRKLKFGQ
jgi:hypothetical protein